MSGGGEVIKGFLARLGFDVDGAGLKKFNGGLASATLRVTAFAAGIQAMSAGLYAGLYKVAESQRKLLDLSEATGVSVAKLEELGYIAEQTGASSQTLQGSLQALQKTMADASMGQGGGLAAFRRLGISVRGANGQLRDTAEVLGDVGKNIRGMSRGKQESFLSQLGIDRSLVPMLTQDVSGLSEAYHKMYSAAGVDAQTAAKASRDYVNEIGSIKSVLGMMAKSVSMAFIGKMSGDLVRFRKALIDNFTKISGIIQVVVKVVMRVAGAFGAIVMRIVGWVGGLMDWFKTLDQGAQRVIFAVGGLLVAWRLLNLGLLATPLGMIITGLIAIVALIDDFQTYMEGGKSLIDWGPWADDIMAVVDALGPLMDALGQVWDMVKGPLMESFRQWGSFIADMFGGVLQAVSSFVKIVALLLQGDFGGALQAVFDLLQGLLDLVGTVVKHVGGMISGAWEGLKGLLGGGDDAPAPAGPVLGPQAAAAGSQAGAGNVTANTVIHVDGARNPEAVARAVGSEQRRVNADLVRNTRGAAR